MFTSNIGQMACQKRAANSNRLKTNKVNKLPPYSEVWKSVECVERKRGIIPHF